MQQANTSKKWRGAGGNSSGMGGLKSIGKSTMEKKRKKKKKRVRA